VLDIEGSGRNLRYDGWRAGNLVFDVDAALTEQGWAGQGTVFADNVVLQDTEQFEAIRLEAVGSPARVGVGLVARRDRLTEASLSGTLELADQVPVGVQLQALSLRLDRSLWQLQRPTVVRWGELTGIQVDSLVLERTGPEEGLIAVDGQIPPVGELDFRVHARNVDVAEFRRLMPTAPPVRGVLTLDASMEGPRTAPELLVQARVDGFQYLDAAAEMLALNARYAAGATVANAAVWQDGVAVASAEGTVPMQVVFENLLPQVELLDDQLVAARVVADSLPLSLVAALVPYVSNGAGVLAADFSISGLLGSPQLSGAGRLSRGAVTLDELNVRFDAIQGDFTLQDQTIEIESLTARSLGGASVTGRITVDDRTRPLFELSGSFNQFRGINRADVATILVSGTVDLVGRYPTPSLTGRVELTGGNITLPPMEDRQAFDIAAFDLTEVIGDPLVTDPLEPTFVEQIVIQNLEVVVGDAVWAVSPQMRVQIAGDMLVSRFGPEQWQIFGDLQARRGSYTLTVGPIVREFDIVSGRIEFFGTPDLNPSLDILAQHRIRATGPGATGILNILVNVTGTAQFPRIALSSDTQPPLPESEILSYLIFGRPTFALGEVGGTLAQQLLLQEALGGLLAAQVEQLIRQAGLPFDYIRLRGRPSPTEFHDPLGTTTLEVGWQLAPNVFWTVEWGVGVLFGNEVGDTWGTSLEWQIDPQWSTRLAWEPLRRDRLLQQRIAATTQLTRQFSLELRRRWEYGISPELPQITEIAGDGDPPEPLPVSPGGSSPDSPPE
jgi:translocation and assembly module TamB